VKLLLNSKPCLHPAGLETWGDWLDLLDRDAPRSGQIVTAVRFDGVDEPAFRAGSIRGRRLSEYESIEARTGTERTLLADTLHEAGEMVSALAAAARAVGGTFRHADLSDAHASLPQLIDGIRGLVALGDQCAAALRVPRAAMVCSGVPFDDWMGEFGRRLAVLIDAQEREDWLTVADSLEYEIAPALDEWRDAFDRLASTALAS
jgi:hypothetical protein